MIYSGKRAVVLGMGRSGEAAAILLREEGAKVTVCESAVHLREKAAKLEALGIRVLLGADAESDPETYDVAVLSPGIEPWAPLVANITAKRIPVIGELELAFSECCCPVIAITGTNGKTTTTELTVEMLMRSGVRTLASGNIGLPFAEAVRSSHELDVMVLETSSFQLETVRSFRAHIAAWMNFSPNHLDRYRSVKEYRAAKLRIFERQSGEDYAVVNARDPLPPLSARTITFSADVPADFGLRGDTLTYRGADIIHLSATRLRGVHNAENLMAAFGMGLAFGLDFERMTQAVLEYTPPTHRCEFVRDLCGIRWINDSKATNLDALEKAIRSQERPIVLIAGGKDKGFEFDPIAPLVRERVRSAILIGEMRERVARSWEGMQCTCAASLEEAISLAQSTALEGDVVLFSPGTSSFDMFANYGERGNRFKELVRQLTPQQSP